MYGDKIILKGNTVIDITKAYLHVQINFENRVP